MKKLLLIVVVLLVSSVCFGQKINSSTYNQVDTLIEYKDAQTITYKNKVGKSVTDTIFFHKQEKDIIIRKVAVLIINDDKKIKENEIRTQ